MAEQPKGDDYFFDKKNGIECFVDDENEIAVIHLSDAIWLTPDAAEAFGQALLKFANMAREREKSNGRT